MVKTMTPSVIPGAFYFPSGITSGVIVWTIMHSKQSILYTSLHTHMCTVFPARCCSSLHVHCMWDSLQLRTTFTLYISMVCKVLWRNMLPIKPGTPGRPLLFSLSAWHVFFYTTLQDQWLMSHPKDQAIWFLSFLLISVTTWTRTHTLLIRKTRV